MTPAEHIDQLVANTPDWRGDTLAAARAAILAADPAIVEGWKYMGSPTWDCDGALIVGNAHKEKVKLTFAYGASLPDPKGLFNNGFGGKVWRAIDFLEGDRVDAAALTALVRAAIAHNREKKAAKAAAKKTKAKA